MANDKLSEKTRSEYLRRIDKALEYINTNIDQPLKLDDIAKAGFFSPYHFHRIFHAIVGETVNDYVSRKRMERSIRRLMYKPEMNVTEIAGEGGFSSAANFSKAFKLYFGVSPTEIRNGHKQPSGNKNSKIGKLYSKYGKEFNHADLYSQFVTNSGAFDPNKLEELLMQVRVEKMQAQPVAYLTSPKGYELDSVYETWGRVLQWAGSVGLDEKSKKKFAICHDNPVITPEDRCRYDAAIEIDPDIKVNSPLIQSTIPEGKYAIAYYKGDGDKIASFMTELCSQWMCNSGYEPDDYPPVFNYLNDSREDDFVEMDVYIKVKDLVAM